MENMKNIRDHRLINEIRWGSKSAFEQLFFDYYYPLCRFALKLTGCSELARDIVQDVFFKLWKNRETWNIQSSLQAYLYKAVRNQGLSVMEKQDSWEMLIDDYNIQIREEPEEETFAEEDFDFPVAGRQDILVHRIWMIVDQMPPQRKTVFELHRKHGLMYAEISQVMDIAPKTVENHMAKALQDLRDKLHVDSD
ncbi:MAG: RNA polymerase sigma-70 factor [Balneolaceae bacterium]